MNVRRFVLLAVFLSVAVILGAKPLVDVDLGWHVATGLFVIDSSRVPVQDPFGVGAHAYVAYSWLCDLLMGTVFRVWSFPGLQRLQLAFVVLSVCAAFVLVARLEEERKTVSGARSAFLLAFLTVFLSPAWHLRPQLLSISALLILSAELRREEVRFWPVFCAVVLWANIHVYWVLAAPFWLVLRGMRALQSGNRLGFALESLRSLALAGAGLVSPYGLANLGVVWSYAVSHREATQLIREFQPLGAEHGAAFWLFLAVSVACLWRWRRISEECSIGDKLLFVAFCGSPLAGIKYLPVWACAVCPVLGRGVLSGRGWAPAFVRAHRETRAEKVLGGAAGVLILGGVALWTSFPEALPARTADLFAAAKAAVTAEDLSRGGEAVVNHFDDGGWLILQFSLERTDGLGLKPLFDGRTLVAGESRLQQFAALRAGGEDACAVVRESGASIAVLPEAFAVALHSCFGGWRTAYRGADYVTLILPKEFPPPTAVR